MTMNHISTNKAAWPATAAPIPIVAVRSISGLPSPC
jgi:hypothetical protein